MDLTLKQFDSVQSKKIVILALMVLIHIDDRFDEEYDLVVEIMNIFKLNKKDLKSYSSWGKAFSALSYFFRCSANLEGVDVGFTL